MHFKTIKTLVISLPLLVSCAAEEQTDYSSDYQIGESPEFYTASNSWGRGYDDGNQVAITERASHTLQHFQLEPFQHIKSVPLPLPYVGQGILAGVNATYFVTLATQGFAIISSDGTANLNPVEMLGNIESAAFDPVGHVLVLADSYKSMGLLVLTNDGTVQGTWKAGSLFADQYVVSGTMLSDGRLVLALEFGTLAVVDVAQSVASQSWVFDSFTLADTGSISWMAPDNNNADQVLLLDGARLLLVDVEARTVADKLDLSSPIALKSRQYAPHVITRSDTETVEIHFVENDKFVSKSMRSAVSSISETWLDPIEGTITAVYNPEVGYRAESSHLMYSKSEVFRFRLSDNLAMDKSEITSDTNLVVTKDFLFLSYESLLGKAERRTYGKTPDIQTVEAYNLDLIRAQYKE